MKVFNSLSCILVFVMTVTLTLQGCSSGGSVRVDNPEKHVIDNGSGGGLPPWVQDTKTSWIAEGGLHRFKAFHSIKGDERLTACYELAKLNAQESITSEVWADFKAAVSHSTQGISESTADIFVQSRNLETHGNLRGLRFTEAFHQRYLVNGMERIDCYVLGELSDGDYRQMRANLLSPIVQASPELQKAVEEKHMDIFRSKPPAQDKKPERDPSSIAPVVITDLSAKGADLKK